jgi:Xaa-Pro aminopeptidase
MAQMEPGSIAVLPAARETLRNRDCEYPFRQDSDFLYLTGFTEPDALLVLVPGRRGGRYSLFCRERDPVMETWTGYRAGPEGACQEYAADEAFTLDRADVEIPALMAGCQQVYYSLGRNKGFDQRMMQWLGEARRQGRAGSVPPAACVDLDPLLHEQRLIKSPAELRLMRKAGRVTAAAHRRAMKSCQPGLLEYQLEAELLHEFMHGGGRFPAYTPIVGGGDNGCILHYVNNDSRLSDGDLVLIDAGCELEHYASDVTRTFPVNGRFSEPQRALYEVVLRAQKAAIEQVGPGRDWNRANAAAIEEITRGLLDLGLLQGQPRKLIEEEAYREFYMHTTGHWLGLDVHDVGSYRQGESWRALEPGMVLTVEPGIYVAPGNQRVAKKWRGIGIRIEDDLVVTETGCENLTQDAPRTIEAIEALMAA